jgi:GMP synthase PP-ATPase subunit
VGGLPEKMKMALCEAARLFKDEVREVGATLACRATRCGAAVPGPDLPSAVGRGQPEKLRILRRPTLLDHEVREAGLYESLAELLRLAAGALGGRDG